MLQSLETYWVWNEKAEMVRQVAPLAWSVASWPYAGPCGIPGLIRGSRFILDPDPDANFIPFAVIFGYLCNFW